MEILLGYDGSIYTPELMSKQNAETFAKLMRLGHLTISVQTGENITELMVAIAELVMPKLKLLKRHDVKDRVLVSLNQDDDYARNSEDCCQ